MMAKALGYHPDAYVPDLEDSVPAAEKVNARQVTKAHIQSLSETGVAVIPRINARDTGLALEDMTTVVCPDIYGISVGKVGTSDDVEWVCKTLSGLERANGMSVGTLKLVLWIETALGIVNCFDICAASDRIEAVAFGAEDFTHDMAIERREDDNNVAHARNTLCIAARAAGILALDTPYFQFHDEAGLIDNAKASKSIGFKGKFAIHPAQIDAINRVFSPSKEEIEHARRVVEAFEQAERQGRGSTSLDGKVIDVPVVKRAQALLAAIPS